ncbi:3-methyl-2-oxobutanoate hydroxymethyltransferase [Komagataeibacter sp. FXV3]|nr:3-methyl-2-oxobutanoate hydroxymethyltransferase [Komagataeibacter sp. FXV3]
MGHGEQPRRRTIGDVDKGDVSFRSYQQSPAQAFGNAARIMAETRCGVVKLEGGAEMADTARFLCLRGIPVCGHVGLMPQVVNTAGGLRMQGRDAQQVREDVRAIADSFAIVLEGTAGPVLREITTGLPIPVMGNGASSVCDGQVPGAFDAFAPRFVRRYANVGGVIGDAAARYAHDVRMRVFPGPEECFGVRGTILPG